MSEIRVQLLGRLCIRRDEQVLARFEAHKMQELFGYLLLHRDHPVSRESLASLLWPEVTTAQSKKKLRQLLWRLQSTLGSQRDPPHDRLFLIESDQIQTNAEADFWLDIVVFERAFEYISGIAGKKLDTRHVQVLHNAVQLYRGPLLEGCYEDWCLYHRERLQNMYLTMLEKLVSYCEVHHDYDAGIQYGMRIINCDRIHERIYQRLMRLYYLNGERAKALHLYEQCATVLDEGLGVKPSKRTMALYKQILTEQLAVPELTFIPIDVQSGLESSNAPLTKALDHLTQLQEFLTNLQDQVQQSKQQLERVMNGNPDPPSPTKTEEGETLQRRSGDATETFWRR